MFMLRVGNVNLHVPKLDAEKVLPEIFQKIFDFICRTDQFLVGRIRVTTRDDINR